MDHWWDLQGVPTRVQGRSQPVPPSHRRLCLATSRRSSQQPSYRIIRQVPAKWCRHRTRQCSGHFDIPLITVYVVLHQPNQQRQKHRWEMKEATKCPPPRQTRSIRTYVLLNLDFQESFFLLQKSSFTFHKDHQFCQRQRYSSSVLIFGTFFFLYFTYLKYKWCLDNLVWY